MFSSSINYKFVCFVLILKLIWRRLFLNNQTEEIIAYFNQLDRSYFIEGESKADADLDIALPIGFEQTISQPSLVLEMTLQLDLKPDSRVLEIGTGSGYQTDLLATFAKEVYTVEKNEHLQLKAKKRLTNKNFTNIHYKQGDGTLGWEKHQPYDRIMVTASASEIPDELLNQLATEGKMIIPVGKDYIQELRLIEKDIDGSVRSTHLNDVAFVRLKGKYE